MELSKWQFKWCPHLTLLCCKATMVAAKMTKNIGKGVGEKDGKDSDEDGENDEGDFDDSHPGPTFRSGICECCKMGGSANLGSPSPCNFRPPLFSFTFSSF